MSIRNAIKAKIPREWEEALRLHKRYTLFVNVVYNDYIPKVLRNKSGCKEAVKYINTILSRNFLTIVTYKGMRGDELKKWSDVYDTILKLEQRWA